MFYPFSSSFILLFLLSLFNHLPYASSNQGLGWCESLFQCGNITTGFPFWGGNRQKPCGHPLLELHCKNNITSLFISSQELHVLAIDQTSKTLTLARTDHLGSFCSSSFNTTNLSSQIFELSPTYKNLTVFYNCDPKFSYPSSFTCPALGHLSMSKTQNSCKDSFRVNVPMSFVPEEKELNLTRLESVLRKGFEVKLMIDEQPCQKCLSTHGICGFNSGVCGYNQTSSSFICYCEDGRHDVERRSNANDSALFVTIIFVVGMFSLAGFITFLVLLCRCVRVQIFRIIKTSDARRQKKLKALIPLKHYTYAKVKKMTKSFAEVVGKGGFGIVYRGTLCDGRMVAVKVLIESKGNTGEDFINEVASMSQTSHVNIVSLLGFCCEGSKRAIIYEFLENGSLDNFISDKTSDFKAMYGIALGVARGLEYLHYGCKTRIVHFDIKPQNVLLDDKFCPKVSDFGLAKLCEKNESILSLLDTRGTIGYIAPEMVSRAYGSVSHKSDVYSYGMLVLEMIGARNKERFDQNSGSNASSMYFPEWIYKDLEKGDSGRRLIENGISSDQEEIVKKMTLVGLWCIQSSPSNRPPMNRVVEMIEGNIDDLEVPPKPVLQQTPATLLSDSFWISEKNSSPPSY